MHPHRIDDPCSEPARRAAAAARRGFSLIELIVVMVITGILALAAVPSVNALAAAQADTAARDLHRDLSYARQHAVATGTRTWVVFNTAAETWSVLSENPASPGRAGATALTDPATSADMTKRLGVNSLSAISLVSADFDGSPEVGFDWLGRPLNASELPLAAPGSARLSGGRTVTVVPGTGLVTLYLP